jgi:hypothetical protein
MLWVKIEFCEQQKHWEIEMNCGKNADCGEKGELWEMK